MLTMWILLAKTYLLISSVIGNQGVVGKSTPCRRYESGCCLNEYNDHGECKECPLGTIGVNCNSECPEGYYGKLCKEVCDCLLDYYCDHRFGCQECPPGSFGFNCSGTCPKKYYGRFCQKECNCTSSQYCDPQRGCLKCDCTSNQYCDPTYGCLPKHKGEKDCNPRKTCTEQETTKVVKQYMNVTNGQPTGVRSELADDDAEATSGTAHEYLQEEAVGNVDNVYADLRISKMVDSDVFNATGDSKPAEDGNRHRKLNYAHIPEENYDLCTLEAASDENTMHDYACVPKNFQCSILSLKRNVDPSLLVDLEPQPKGPVDDAYDLIDICGQTYNKVQTTTLLNLTQVCV